MRKMRCRREGVRASERELCNGPACYLVNDVRVKRPRVGNAIVSVGDGSRRYQGAPDFWRCLALCLDCRRAMAEEMADGLG